MNKVVAKIIASLTLTSMITVGAAGYTANAAELSREEIYPLFDITGTLLLRVPSVNSDKDEFYTFRIIEENRDLTVITCDQNPNNRKVREDLIDIIFKDGKCIMFQHNGTVTKKVYTDFTADIHLDEEIPADSEGRTIPSRDMIKGGHK